jgi:hypothetical protein
MEWKLIYNNSVQIIQGLDWLCHCFFLYISSFFLSFLFFFSKTWSHCVVQAGLSLSNPGITNICQHTKLFYFSCLQNRNKTKSGVSLLVPLIFYIKINSFLNLIFFQRPNYYKQILFKYTLNIYMQSIQKRKIIKLTLSIWRLYISKIFCDELTYWYDLHLLLKMF